jgi:threonine dehydratase
MNLAVDALSIAAAAQRIAPHVRRTPVISVDGSDFGLEGVRLVFKLEFLQHAGSFKTRGAFNSLLSRDIPPVGVVAASGGNHGAAVAFAAMKTKHPATIFVPNVASPAKLEQIRGYGARLEIAGERYNDALIASEAFVAKSGAAAIHAYDQPATLAGRGPSRWNSRSRRNRWTPCWWRRRRRAHRRHGGVVRGTVAGDRRGTGSCAHAHARAGSGRARGRAGGRDRRGLARASAWER